MRFSLRLAAAVAASCWIGLAELPALGQGAVLKRGGLRLGVGALGHLGARESPDSSYVGLAAAGLGDAVARACFCEGWGVGVSTLGLSGYVKTDVVGGTGDLIIRNGLGGAGMLSLESFTSTSSTATSVTRLADLPAIKVTHDFRPAAKSNAFFESVVTIENEGFDVSGLRYRRVIDFDHPDTPFDELMTFRVQKTTGGLADNLDYSSDQWLATTDPLGSRGTPVVSSTESRDVEDAGPADQGALFDLVFGDLAAGESRRFSIFFGVAPNELEAQLALRAIGAEVFAFAEAGTPGGGSFGDGGVFMIAFTGVGGDPYNPSVVPEPGALALAAGLVLAGVPLVRRGRRR